MYSMYLQYVVIFITLTDPYITVSYGTMNSAFFCGTAPKGETFEPCPGQLQAVPKLLTPPLGSCLNFTVQGLALRALGLGL